MSSQLDIAKELRDDEIQYYKDIADGKPAKLHTDEILSEYESPSGTVYIWGIFITLAVGLILMIAGNNATSYWGSSLVTGGCIGMHSCACAVYGIACLWFLHEYLDCQRAEKMWPGIKKQLGYEPTLGPTIFFGVFFCLLLAIVLLEYPEYPWYQEWMEHVGEVMAKHYN